VTVSKPPEFRGFSTNRDCAVNLGDEDWDKGLEIIEFFLKIQFLLQTEPPKRP
jgi:hypothetical protein